MRYARRTGPTFRPGSGNLRLREIIVTNPPVPPQPGQQPTGAYPPAPSNAYPQTGYPQPGYAQPGYPQHGYPGYAPPPAGNSVLKIVLICVGILVLFGVLGAVVLTFGAYKLSKSVHHDANGDVSFSTPAGSFSTSNNASVTADELALPEYPGAIRVPGTVKMKTPANSLVTATYTTTDSPAEVIAFYRHKLGPQLTMSEHGTGTTLSDDRDDHEKKVVTVREQNGTTKITLLHSTLNR